MLTLQGQVSTLGPFYPQRPSAIACPSPARATRWAYRRRIDAAPDLTPDTRRLYLAELQAGLMGTTYLED